MSDLYTPFAQDLMMQIGIVILIVAAVFFVWKLAKPHG
jgi:hypothetical protein